MPTMACHLMLTQAQEASLLLQPVLLCLQLAGGAAQVQDQVLLEHKPGQHPHPAASP